MNKKAFTLIELLIVVLIIGILAAIAVPKYQLAVSKARLMKGVPLAKDIKVAQDSYYLANGKWANSFSDLDITLPEGCTDGQAGRMKCGDNLYGFVFAKYAGAYPTGLVYVYVKNPQFDGYCGRINFPFAGSYSGWFYQWVNGPSCKVASEGLPAGKKEACLEFARRLCRNISGKEPVSDEYPL